MNLGKRAIEGLQVWLFYSVIAFLTTPSKRMAIALSIAVAILTLMTFATIVALTLIYRSLANMRKRFPSSCPPDK